MRWIFLGLAMVKVNMMEQVSFKAGTYEKLKANGCAYELCNSCYSGFSKN